MIGRPTLALLAMLVAACSGDAGVTAGPPTGVADPGTPTAPPVELTVYAAASLKGALEQAKVAYEAANEGVTLTISTDASSALEAKIEQGARGDVFLSADTANPDRLRAGGFTAGDPVNFARNTLVIVVPRDGARVVKSPFDLAKAGVKVIAAGDNVPITKYASKLIQNLSLQPDAPAAFEAACAANVVSKEDNVKAVVAKIELGEGDAAIVYATDAAASGRVETVAITPPGANVPVTYGGVVLKSSTNESAAAAFLAWLAGPDGQALLAGSGFIPPPG